ncbi:MAG: TIGR01777 family oxidoreductase [Candidatus Omnitrophota bacterium]
MPYTIAITGSTGLIGTCLWDQFSRGHKVIRVVRPQTHGVLKLNCIFWNPARGVIEPEKFEGLDAVIHLAGANIAAKRWTPQYRKAVLSSRVNTTRLLVDAFHKVNIPPRLFICASAVGIYGAQHDMSSCVDESVPADDRTFLARVCRQWEEEAARAREAGVRTVQMRFGAVLSGHGGMLKRLLPIFKMGLGGPAGSGRQPMSWVALEEIPRIVEFLISHPHLNGPVNCVSPQPVTNAEFSRILARVLQKPCALRLPGFVLRALYGQMAQELILTGQCVRPEALLSAVYAFRYPHLDTALDHELHRQGGRC